MTRTIGYVGLGNIGGAMAVRLAGHDHHLVVYDLVKERMDRLSNYGAEAAQSPADVASRTEIVYLSLPTPESVREVCLGAKGLIEGSKIRVCFDLSTTGRDMAREVAAALKERDIDYLDAPVSGGVPGAEKGTLAVMVSGPEAAFREAEQTLRTIGHNTFYIGTEAGLGHMMKLINNVLSASAMVISMEALACGVKAGLDADTMLAVINASSGRNTATTDKFPKAILPRTFDYGFNTELMYKDLKLLMQHADNLHVPMFLGRQVTSMWAFAMSQGEGPKDYTNLMKHIERWAGVEVRGKAAKG